MQLFPPFPEGKDLVSVLDLDNAAVGSCEPPHPHSGAADNADNLSERCERSGFPAARVRLDGKAVKRFPIKSKKNGGA